MHTYLKWFIYSASVKILALKYMSVALLISQNNEYTGKITEFFFFYIIFFKKLKSWIKKHSGSSTVSSAKKPHSGSKYMYLH